MGMYDEISTSLSSRIVKRCPYCCTIYDIEECWQTKDFESMLRVLSLSDIDHDVFEMHHICSNCNRYISVVADLRNSKYRYRSSGKDEYSDELLIDDPTLTTEFLNLKLKDNDLIRCLKSKSIGYNSLIDMLDADYMDKYMILHELIKDFYVIPKENTCDDV